MPRQNLPLASLMQLRESLVNSRCMNALTRHATAKWHGTGVEGNGALSTQSGVFASQPYSYLTRFKSEDGKAGTNPEELIAAALASCFTMALAFLLTGGGHPPEWLETKATLRAENPDLDWTLKSVKLELVGKVAGVDLATFRRLAEQAKQTCPVSRALKLEVTLEAKLS
jgi:osmotically inducible protein OsmC